MNSDLAKRLTQSVETFYQTHGTAFAKTRGMGWKEMELAAAYAKPGMSVIDVGAGNGRFANELPKGTFYLGFEPSDSLRASNPKSNLVKGSFPKLDLKNEASDLTTCFAVLHHLVGQDQREQAVEELTRITKPGGIIVASTWALDPTQYESIEEADLNDIWIPWHAEGVDAKRYVHAFSLEEWKTLWDKPELTIEHIGYFGKNDWTDSLANARNLLVIARKHSL